VELRASAARVFVNHQNHQVIFEIERPKDRPFPSSIGLQPFSFDQMPANSAVRTCIAKLINLENIKTALEF
jgi:hypothetical protein